MRSPRRVRPHATSRPAADARMPAGGKLPPRTQICTKRAESAREVSLHSLHTVACFLPSEGKSASLDAAFGPLFLPGSSARARLRGDVARTAMRARTKRRRRTFTARAIRRIVASRANGSRSSLPPFAKSASRAGASRHVPAIYATIGSTRIKPCERLRQFSACRRRLFAPPCPAGFRCEAQSAHPRSPRHPRTRRNSRCSAVCSRAEALTATRGRSIIRKGSAVMRPPGLRLVQRGTHYESPPRRPGGPALEPAAAARQPLRDLGGRGPVPVSRHDRRVRRARLFELARLGRVDERARRLLHVASVARARVPR